MWRRSRYEDLTSHFIDVMRVSQSVFVVAERPSVRGGLTYITNVTVVDVATGREDSNRTVVISNDRIAEIQDNGCVKPAAGARVVNGTGKFLIPWLWDMERRTMPVSRCISQTVS